jgi:hypothetical protein
MTASYPSAQWARSRHMISRNGPKGWRTGAKRDSAHFRGPAHI